MLRPLDAFRGLAGEVGIETHLIAMRHHPLAQFVDRDRAGKIVVPPRLSIAARQSCAEFTCVACLSSTRACSIRASFSHWCSRCSWALRSEASGVASDSSAENQPMILRRQQVPRVEQGQGIAGCLPVPVAGEMAGDLRRAPALDFRVLGGNEPEQRTIGLQGLAGLMNLPDGIRQQQGGPHLVKRRSSRRPGGAAGAGGARGFARAAGFSPGLPPLADMLPAVAGKQLCLMWRDLSQKARDHQKRYSRSGVRILSYPFQVLFLLSLIQSFRTYLEVNNRPHLETPHMNYRMCP